MQRCTIWSVIKKFVIWIVCILLLGTLCFIFVAMLKITLTPYQVTSETISVQQTVAANNNMYQNNADVDIFQVNGTLYYCIENWPGSLGLRSRFSGRLCTIENGRIHVLQKASIVHGNDDRFVYYEYNNQLMAYDTHLKKASMLTKLPELARYDVVLQSDGTLVFFQADTDTVCISVKNGAMVEQREGVAAPSQYILGEKQYSVRKRHVYCEGEDISDFFGDASFRAIVPYQEGLLLINDGYGNLIYYIQEDGQILDVFPEFMCFSSESSINFYEHYIFVSFMRWEGWDESGLGIKHFEDDQLAGTYRIDIRDFSIEKISDKIYSGMYIFDDSGIYTCDRDGNISKISFSGDELQLIVD